MATSTSSFLRAHCVIETIRGNELKPRTNNHKRFGWKWLKTDSNLNQTENDENCSANHQQWELQQNKGSSAKSLNPNVTHIQVSTQGTLWKNFELLHRRKLPGSTGGKGNMSWINKEKGWSQLHTCGRHSGNLKSWGWTERSCHKIYNWS